MIFMEIFLFHVYFTYITLLIKNILYFIINKIAFHVKLYMKKNNEQHLTANKNSSKKENSII